MYYINSVITWFTCVFSETMPPKQVGKAPRKRRRIQSPGDTVVTSQHLSTAVLIDAAQEARQEPVTQTPGPVVVSNQVPIDYAELAKQILAQQQQNATKQSMTTDQASAVVPTVERTSSQTTAQDAPPLPADKSSSAASSLTSILDTVFAVDQGESSSPGPATDLYSLTTFTDLNSVTCSILAASLTGTSRTSYRHSWRLFQTMTNACSLPLSLQNICNFIGYLFEKEYSASSIASHISALSYVHKLMNLPDPTQTFIVKQLLKGCHKLLPSQDSRLPITKDILQKLIKATICKITVPQAFNHSLLQALYLLCFNAFLRLGEVVVSDKDRVLQVEDITFHGNGTLPQNVQIVIRHHKSQKKSEPIIISIQGNTENEFYPVYALHKYRTICLHSSGPFFQFIDGTPVTYSYVTNQLSTAIDLAGLNPKRFKGHSFGIGAATHAAQLGYSESCIQHLGRWNSNALHRYISIKSFQL
ncbi:uncharacterized protein LOC134262215 [Saccostrea cucullata]|uniref:uncharacterized protein LOC134262215 n=1 Tax=Saccostrea cuccullata TaxID=36930 RepID=UPI002ED23FBB